MGFDQLAEIRAGEDSDIRLDFWNADGSRAGACGNATRCVAWLVMRDTGRDALDPHGAGAVARGAAGGWDDPGQHGAAAAGLADVPLREAADTLHLPLPGDPVAVGMGNPIACSLSPMPKRSRWN